MSKVGRLTLSGTPEQNQAMRPFAKRVRRMLANRIDPVTVIVFPRERMPRYRAAKPTDGPIDGRAEGYWRGPARRILLADDLFDGTGGPLDETLGHRSSMSCSMIGSCRSSAGYCYRCSIPSPRAGPTR